MKQQTAVEWLIKQILEEKIKFTYTDMGIMWEQRDDLFEQAKAIEKEQIMTAWLNGDNDSMYEPKQLEKQAEQYYNETYDK